MSTVRPAGPEVQTVEGLALLSPVRRLVAWRRVREQHAQTPL